MVSITSNTSSSVGFSRNSISHWFCVERGRVSHVRSTLYLLETWVNDFLSLSFRTGLEFGGFSNGLSVPRRYSNSGIFVHIYVAFFMFFRQGGGHIIHLHLPHAISVHYHLSPWRILPARTRRPVTASPKDCGELAEEWSCESTGRRSSRIVSPARRHLCILR